MAAGTALSRATGLGRTVVLASVLGVTALGDAYNVANVVPNMIFQLSAGGILSAALVPLLVRMDDDRQRKQAIGVLVGTVGMVGLVASGVLAAVAPQVVRLLTIAGRDSPDYPAMLDVGTAWLRLFAPQVLLYTLSVLAVGIMAARRRLVLGAFASVATNIVTILGAVAFGVVMGTRRAEVGSVSGGAVAILGWATTAGVAAMAGLQLWGAFRCEPGIRPRVRPAHPAVRQIGRLGKWVVVYVVVNQLGLAAVVALAASVEGGVSAHQWAFALMQLPYAVVAVSIVSAAFPLISRAAADDSDVTPVVADAVRRMAFLLVPAAVGLAVVADPLARALTGEQGSELVAAALRGFAVALVPFSLFQLLTRTSYAFEDTRVPALVNVVLNAVTVAWAAGVVLLVDTSPARMTGLALGDAAGYTTGCIVLTRQLAARRGVRPRDLVGPSRPILSSSCPRSSTRLRSTSRVATAAPGRCRSAGRPTCPVAAPTAATAARGATCGWWPTASWRRCWPSATIPTARRPTAPTGAAGPGTAPPGPTCG